MKSIYSGNMESDGENTRGWVFGSFKEPESLQNSDLVEIKWGIHKKGVTRDDWAPGVHERSVAILVSGWFIMQFPDSEVELSKPGDYVVWTKDVKHKWISQENSTIITIRWDSETQ